MKIELVPILAEVVKEYLTVPELDDLADLFDFELEYEEYNKPAYIKIARKLITQIELGNNRRFLEMVASTLSLRCSKRVAHTSFERQGYHIEMETRIAMLLAEIGGPKVPSELTVPGEHPFTAKSEVREHLGKAETEVTIVDNYIGPGTLDCLRDVQHPIKLLTGNKSVSIEEGFDRSLAEFGQEGLTINVRRHPKLHDRYILFNDRCWLVGSSLKDAGKKTLSIIECIDSKSAIVGEVETKWQAAVEYSV